MPSNDSSLTPLGKIFSFLVIVGLLGLGGYIVLAKRNTSPPRAQEAPSQVSGDAPGGPAQDGAPGAAKAVAPSTVEPLRAVPALSPASPYEPRDNTVDIELSEYAGYSGLIVANGGIEPNENSFFFKNHGFKVRIRLSEEESWPALNSGKMAASATTVDVLAAYGRQFSVVVPAQIGFSRGADGVVVRDSIRRINDLKGKTLATSQFTEADFFTRYLAQEAGISVAMLADLSAQPDPQRINLVFAEDAFAAGDLFLADLRSGRSRLSGCVTWAPKTTEVADQSGGSARVLVTNKNLLIIADILVVNKGFAEKHPEMVAGLVAGLLAGNKMARENAGSHLAVIGAAFKWTPDEARDELRKVHLSNLAENLAFFRGTIDAAGSFDGIFQSAVYAYGKELIPNPADPSRFPNLKWLEELEKSGKFAGERVEIAPIKSSAAGPVENDPLLSKDIRFFFQPNSAALDLKRPENLELLDSVKRLLQVAPGSTLLLRGHVDNSLQSNFRQQGGETFVRQMALKAMELSRARAAEIRRILIERAQLSPDRIETVGRGWEEPASATNPEQNRRVEVQWFTVE